MLSDYEAAEARTHGLNTEEISEFCPETGRTVFKDGRERQLTEVITRCMGYHRPVSFWNIGKKAEHATRKFFTEAKAMSHVDTTPQPVAHVVPEGASALHD